MRGAYTGFKSMEKEVLLSIIIPVYNLEKYIVPCLDSIIRNEGISRDCYEIIVVNDGSTDSSQQTVENFILQHPDNHISLHNQENKGVSVARNLGLEKAQGKYVWFIDGDDAIFMESIRLIAEVIRKFDVDVIRIGLTVMDVLFDNNSAIANYRVNYKQEGYFLTDAFNLLNKKYRFGHTAHIWKKRFLIEYQLQYPVGIFLNEDIDFLCEALLKAGQAYINMSYHFYLRRERIGSVSRSKHTFQKWDKLIFDRFYVLNHLLKLQHQYRSDSERTKMLELVTERYIYGMLAYLFFQRSPLIFVRYSILKLRALGLYPLINPGKQKLFKNWLINHPFIFLYSCWLYKIWKRGGQ